MWRWLLAAILVLVFFASSVAAFGRGAPIVGGPCLVALSVIWIWRNGGKHAFAAILVVLTAMTVYILLSPAVSGRRETDRRAYCANNLHSIALALLSYDQGGSCLTHYWHGGGHPRTAATKSVLATHPAPPKLLSGASSAPLHRPTMTLVEARSPAGPQTLRHGP